MNDDILNVFDGKKKIHFDIFVEKKKNSIIKYTYLVYK